jgi:hypothetical protein
MNFKKLRDNVELSDITTDELRDAIEALLEQGFIVEIRDELTADTTYRTTELGEMVKDHIASDVKSRN